jgi:hypothetical protein
MSRKPIHPSQKIPSIAVMIALNITLNTVRSVLVTLFRGTANASDYGDWTEVNGMKYLFHPTQTWRPEQANYFLRRALEYLGV